MSVDNCYDGIHDPDIAREFAKREEQRIKLCRDIGHIEWVMKECSGWEGEEMYIHLAALLASYEVKLEALK